MVIKLIGAFLILVSGSSIGWIIGSIYINRVRELEELQLALHIFDTEINYGQTILPQALRITSRMIKDPLSKLFLQTANELSSTRKKNFFELWQKGLHNLYHKSSLTRNDIKILINWGRQVGNTSLENQQKINKLTIQRLETQEKLARDLANQRVKPVRYAGVLLSLMVIILFY